MELLFCELFVEIGLLFDKICEFELEKFKEFCLFWLLWFWFTKNIVEKITKIKNGIKVRKILDLELKKDWKLNIKMKKVDDCDKK